MSPILGIWASAIQPSLANSYQSIATVTGNGSATTLAFSSIPQTYKHLQLRWIGRDARSATTQDTFQIYFNSDSNSVSPYSNYSRHAIRGDGSSASAYSVVSSGSLEVVGIGIGTAASASANIFGAGIVDILDYTNTNKNTTVRTLGGNDQNGSGVIDFISSAWYNTAAITTITIVNNGTSAFNTNSHFALYGIKG